MVFPSLIPRSPRHYVPSPSFSQWPSQRQLEHGMIFEAWWQLTAISDPGALNNSGRPVLRKRRNKMFANCYVYRYTHTYTWPKPKHPGMSVGGSPQLSGSFGRSLSDRCLCERGLVSGPTARRAPPAKATAAMRSMAGERIDVSQSMSQRSWCQRCAPPFKTAGNCRI